MTTFHNILDSGLNTNSLNSPCSAKILGDKTALTSIFRLIKSYIACLVCLFLVLIGLGRFWLFIHASKVLILSIKIQDPKNLLNVHW